MLPPMKPDTFATDEQRIRLAEKVTVAHHRYNSPPTPVRLLERAAADVHIGRFAWTQRADEVPEREVRTFDEGRLNVAEGARSTPNPLRELAAELVRYADVLDRQGIVPLGVHLCTVYQSRPGSFGLDWDSEVAVVTTTVRGVSREWIDQTLGADEKDPPASFLSPDGIREGHTALKAAAIAGELRGR